MSLTARSILAGIKNQAPLNIFTSAASQSSDSNKKAAWRLGDLPAGPGREQLESVLDILPPLSLKFGPWCAGGAVRRIAQGREISDGDLDFFFSNRAEWAKFDKVLKDYEELHRSNAATTYMVNGLKVQIIKRRFYDSLDELLGDFDFTVCQVATDGKRMGHTREAIKDIDDQVLRFAPQGRISKLTVIGRMVKYINHGFVPETGLFRMVVESGLDLTSAHAIFSPDRPSANYDHDAKVDEVMDAKVFDSDAMRKAAERLGVTL